MAMNSKQKDSKTPQIIEQYGSCCCWCGRNLSPKERTFEHLIPKSMGGTNDNKNLRFACIECNSKRGNKFFPFKGKLSLEKVELLLNVLHQIDT